MPASQNGQTYLNNLSVFNRFVEMALKGSSPYQTSCKETILAKRFIVDLCPSDQWTGFYMTETLYHERVKYAFAKLAFVFSALQCAKVTFLHYVILSKYKHACK